MTEQNEQAYPLQWPDGRTRTSSRSRARFGRSGAPIPVVRARLAVLEEIRRLGGRDVVISSNVRTRLDGLPYADAKPDGGDPAVAVYFLYQKQRVAFACDRWDRLADNLWSIAKSIEAIRGLERWGTGEMVAAALKGYRALPPPQKPWRMVFGYGAETRPLLADVEKRYRTNAATLHPDRPGGDASRMAELNAARDDARAELDS